ncbi:MAG: AAA family ATPase [Acidimicrobiales bacterium]
MSETPVVVLQGARSVGKSTVLSVVARHHDVEITDLDDLAVRARVAASPSDAVLGPHPVCIDEYRHVPELLQAIKAQLNNRHDNGSWLLTGSASFWAMPRGT